VARVVDTSLSCRRVTRVLEQILVERGTPQVIRCDNGPESTSRHFPAWCTDRKIELVHSQPGGPMQNGRAEGSDWRFRRNA
jgi:putative transposase